jgi:glycosyltransferase involved in cell wall biosynthesis
MTRRSIAFTNMVHQTWTAGGQYLYNLLYAIKSSNLDFELVLRADHGTPPDAYKMYAGLIDRVIETPSYPLLLKLPARTRRKILRMVSFDDYFLKKHRIDAQFTLMDPGSARKIPSAVWIPDFQYLHFPEFYTKQDLENYSRDCAEAAEYARVVIASSESVCRDFEQAAPGMAHKARVLRFVAQISDEAYQTDPAEIAAHYHLPEKYFFLPNQLWQHKNHRIVLQALAIAKEEFPEITVACTGATHDHRNPGYFDLILSEIATLGLQSNFRILGKIPRPHFYPLMRGAVAVLQPSLFEGWSTTVEEVKSLGKTIILSDIPVHREQNPPAVRFFDPHDARALASVMQNLQREKNPTPEIQLEGQAKSALPERTKEFARAFKQIMDELLSA